MASAAVGRRAQCSARKLVRNGWFNFMMGVVRACAVVTKVRVAEIQHTLQFHTVAAHAPRFTW